MSESKHTPGERKIRTYVSGDGTFVAEVWSAESLVTIASMYYRGDDAEGREATLADAQLDAAAPQMLEALREAPTPRDGEPPEFFAVRCLKWLRTHRDPAIAAATGGEQ